MATKKQNTRRAKAPRTPDSDRVKKAMAEKDDSMLTASEAVYGFAGWLTTRQKPVIFSESHNAAPVAQLVNAYVTEQQLDPPRDNWNKHLRPMTLVATELTNQPLECAGGKIKSLSFQEVLNDIMSKLRGFSPQRRNHLVGAILQDLKESLTEQVDSLHENINHQLAQKNELRDAQLELLKICGGEFTIVRI